MTHDVLILGGGPAGLTAALYAARASLDVLVLEQGEPGGELNKTEYIENYPGVGRIEGPALAQAFHQDALREGAKVETYWSVNGVHKEESGLFRVEASSFFTGETQNFYARSVIATAGGTPVPLRVPGYDTFYGRGISHCATCDGPMYRGKQLVVIGGGDAAVEEGHFLTNYASKVYLVHRRDQLRAAKVLQERLLSNPKAEVLWNRVCEEIIGGDGTVTHVRLKDVTGSQEDLILPADGVFIFVGFQPNAQVLAPLGPLPHDAGGHIITDEYRKTPVPGLFIGGDLRSQPARQVTTAAADGTIAALSAAHYIEENWR